MSNNQERLDSITRALAMIHSQDEFMIVIANAAIQRDANALSIVNSLAQLQTTIAMMMEIEDKRQTVALLRDTAALLEATIEPNMVN